jgi:glycerate-2-kinase
LERQQSGFDKAAFPGRSETTDRVSNHVIGNIDVALAAAQKEAKKRGYDVLSSGGCNSGIAQEAGREFADRCLDLQSTSSQPTCLLSGGEPTVQVVATDQRRKGGRNQELVLAAGQRLWDEDVGGLVLLSGGTDGEDGPTDAAGAFLDAEVLRQAHLLQLRPEEYLAINNSYAFFEQAGGHLKTGPTHTNVMDLRVGLIAPRPLANRDDQHSSRDR